MSIKFEGGEIDRSPTGIISESSKNYLFLCVTLTGVESDDVGSEFLDGLTQYLIANLDYYCELVGCPSWSEAQGRFKSQYYDSIAIERDHGYIAGQKTKIMKRVKAFKRDCTEQYV